MARPVADRPDAALGAVAAKKRGCPAIRSSPSAPPATEARGSTTISKRTGSGRPKPPASRSRTTAATGRHPTLRASPSSTACGRHRPGLPPPRGERGAERVVLAADGEQTGHVHRRRRVASHVDPAATGDHVLTGGARTRAEVADWEAVRLGTVGDHCVARTSRLVRGEMSNRPRRTRWVAVEQDGGEAPSRSVPATALFRGLCRLLPFPCANRAIPLASAGTTSSPRLIPSMGISTTCWMAHLRGARTETGKTTGNRRRRGSRPTRLRARRGTVPERVRPRGGVRPGGARPSPRCGRTRRTGREAPSERSCPTRVPGGRRRR